jgi:hypothetical protein
MTTIMTTKATIIIMSLVSRVIHPTIRTVHRIIITTTIIMKAATDLPCLWWMRMIVFSD